MMSMYWVYPPLEVQKTTMRCDAKRCQCHDAMPYKNHFPFFFPSLTRFAYFLAYR